MRRAEPRILGKSCCSSLNRTNQPHLSIHPSNVQVVHAVSHLPAGSNAKSAAAAVRALDPRYTGVTAVDSGMVDVLTRLETPGDAEEEERVGGGKDNGNDRREEEIAHEQLLFGMEVRRVWCLFGWLVLCVSAGWCGVVCEYVHLIV